jgi:hypothetical protein
VGFLPGWGKRLKLTIDQAKIDTANQENFPVLAYLSAASGITSADISCIFDELDYPSVDDSFTGVNGSSPNSDRWTEVSNCEIQSNKLRFPLMSTSGRCKSVWRLNGDFDIQIDFDLLTYPSVNAWIANFRVVFSNGDYFSVGRAYYSEAHRYLAERKISGGTTSIGTAVTSDISGKLRIVRSGTNYSLYYYNAGWVQLGSTYSYSTLVDCEVNFLRSTWAGNPAISYDFDNFIINSGSFIWPQKTHPNRKKIAFTTSDGVTQCYAEIERWDDASEKAWLWVKVPSVAYNSDTDLYIYYDKDHADNTTYVGDTEDAPAQNVWDDNFVLVQHMGQDPNGDVADAIKDSTSNANHGTPGGSMTSADLVDGKVGKALDFDGLDDCVTIAENATLDIAGNITLEALIQSDLDQVGTIRQIINKEATYTLVFDHTAAANRGAFMFRDSALSWQGSGATVISKDTYHSFAGSYDGTDVKAFLDGSESASNNIGPVSIDNTDGTLYVGSYGGSPFSGISDEARISNIARSAPWIKATYHSNWDSLITFGSEEESIIATNLFDGKVKIKDSTTDLFDGKVDIIGWQANLLDGKLRIFKQVINLFNGKLSVAKLSTILFNGKVGICSKTINLLDGKVKIQKKKVCLFDGKGTVNSLGLSLLDGKLRVKPFPVVDVEFPFLEMEAFTGGIADLALPFLSLEAEVTVGEIASVNIEFPSFTMKALIGAKGIVLLSSLKCSSEALVGITSFSNIEIPLVRLDASALVETLASFDVSLSSLQVAACSVVGVITSGNVVLYPLQLIANGMSGPLALANTTLPSLIMEAELAHVITGDVDIVFPSFSLLARAITLSSGCSILKYDRRR